jgi:AntA/AntB antirepressor
VFMHEIAGQQVQAVNLRELWENLESGQHYADWIKKRISQYGFVEGRDYVTIDQELLIGGKRRMVKGSPAAGRGASESNPTMDCVELGEMAGQNFRPGLYTDEVHLGFVRSSDGSARHG